ncbi:MAG: cytidine deaminase [Bdellovibrionales bacterium]|nr:cytidine deaminase [Bdellovibrionales bacterium]
MSELNSDLIEAHKAAVGVLKNSHSPYSHLKVGAALKVKGQEELVLGTNVENASFGATICAERAAILQAISRYGNPGFEYMVIVSDSPSGMIPPCGMCLQVMQEFVDENFPIHLGTQNKLVKTVLFSEMVPIRFLKEMLPRP